MPDSDVVIAVVGFIAIITVLFMSQQSAKADREARDNFVRGQMAMAAKMTAIQAEAMMSGHIYELQQNLLSTQRTLIASLQPEVARQAAIEESMAAVRGQAEEKARAKERAEERERFVNKDLQHFTKNGGTTDSEGMEDKAPEL